MRFSLFITIDERFNIKKVTKLLSWWVAQISRRNRFKILKYRVKFSEKYTYLNNKIGKLSNSKIKILRADKIYFYF